MFTMTKMMRSHVWYVISEVKSVPMNKEQILQKFETLRQWGSNGERALHKPLLVLYAIGKLLRGEERLISYKHDIEENLKNLLREFGPRRDSYNPHFPFWRLQNDGIWEVTNAINVRETASGDAYISDLRNYNVSGGFNETICESLQDDSELCYEIIQRLLNVHFQPTIHDDILQALDIELPSPVYIPRSRPSNFRRSILKAYEYRCAICGFDVRLRNSPIGLEAAHIQWQMAGGPDDTVNGLALCSLHHKLFDRGAFTISRELHILVSDEAHGTTGFQEWLMNFHGQSITLPQRQSYNPAQEFVDWHVREVFQGDYRELS